MNAHSEDPRRFVTATAADLIAKSYSFAEVRKSSEASYRRGVHQCLALAYDLVEESGSVREALRQLARAEKIAGELRFVRKDKGGGMLLDFIRQRMARKRKPAGAGSR